MISGLSRSHVSSSFISWLWRRGATAGATPLSRSVVLSTVGMSNHEAIVEAEVLADFPRLSFDDTNHDRSKGGRWE